ncbi:glutamate synthase small subunit [Parashewanella spongiae]|uniref:Glutamate synthase small subunit n=1 Tax=Parashewanella spongiae TaxID=342950 RepID=A0A3A6TYU4_9GAMM|nr:FAD-dependent oxidoreductase [Parashewanella spongiae]MCL1077647.1 FAD-dependent oxidoreductase [Parashewanella spongiae]RJY18126.1 glutamate synthase small subunit [Parashewanella spongiae]
MSNDFQFIELKRALPRKHSIEQRQQQFIEIYQPDKNDNIQAQADRCLDCGNPYCEWKCPLHNYIPNWLKLIKEERLMEAADLVHQTNSLPEVCGRVCPQDRLCEGACTINEDFGAVTIGNIEKYITDTAIAQGWKPDLSHVVNRNEKVAIIGAGPAGLACADVLARNGIKATVYDKYPEIGGLLTYGIPAFKLEKDVIQTRRKLLESMGIRFQLNTTIGDDIEFSTLEKNHDAVFLGMGAYKAITAGIPNETATGVYQALPYLIANTQALMQSPQAEYPYINVKDKVVVVLGGGDTSMDCVRTAVRQGAKKVTLIYRRDKASMPGSVNEVNNAIEEGVEFIFHRQPISIEAENGQVIGVKCIATDQSFESQHQNHKEQIYAADALIIAFGFKPSPSPWFAKESVNVDESGKVIVDHTLYPFQTDNPKVFAGGDMVRGADLVVTAIAEGRKAALGILDYLSDKK